MTYLTPKQIAVLLEPIKEHRVGTDGKGFSHVEAYELRAHLNRIFGFCRWSEEVIEQALVYEEAEQRTSKQGKAYLAHSVCYRSVVRLTVCAPDGAVLATYTEGATGDAQNQPSRADAHDLALKTSASQAFKRCCMNLGDSFGLSLYRKGSTQALVKVTLVGLDSRATADKDLQDAAPPTERPADEPPDEGPQDVTARPMPEQPVAEPSPAATPGGKRTPDEYRELLLAATRRHDVVRHLRDLSLDGHAEAQTADENGQAILLADLAQRRMREVPA